ncbi:MAG: spore maturation protein [Deltaproteobacteria bacterium]|nr:spore maturation protein [Deltaproteobacteria bacterium]
MTSSPQPTTPQKMSAMGAIYIFFVLGAIVVGSFSGKMKEVGDASFQAAKDSVTLAIGLVGVMAFWLGMVRVLEAGGFVLVIARWVRVIMEKLFPDVPSAHPAMGAMTMNIAANMLGLGNAATPFGIKAMTELNRLNPLPGTATNAMCLFLAINTSSVTIFPLGVIGVRAAAGCSDPAGIFLPTFFSHTCATIVGIVVAVFFARRDKVYQTALAAAQKDGATEGVESAEPELATYDHLRFFPSFFVKGAAWVGLLAFVFAAVDATVRAAAPGQFLMRDILGTWLISGLILLIVFYSMTRGVKLYEAVTEGAKQGFDVAIRIIPFLVAMLVAIAMFRASGAMAILADVLSPVTLLVGMPVETVPMALIRPLSGSGAFAIMGDLIQQAPDSYNAFVASVMMGASDTTFYILAVYFGSVGVVRIRHALVAGIAADLTGMLCACLFSPFFFHA